MRFVPIFIAEFLFSLHFAATLYINSSFLEHFFPLHYVGLMYVYGALLSLIFFFRAPRMLNKLGNRKFMLVYLSLTLAATVGAAFSTSRSAAVVFFLLYAAVSPLVFYALDVLVEELTVNRKTGEIRGLYLTVLNSAIVLGPILITLFSTDGQFKGFYIAAAVVLLPIFFLALILRSRYKHKKYESHSLPLRAWWRKKSVRRVTLARFILEFFYALMVIYTPIYLHSTIGFDWKKIGVMFVIMLLPFVIFEWPVGELADKKTGEKEIMSLGFAIMTIALLFMPFIGQNFAYWTIALFVSRVGAAFIEITTETYFFKRVSAEDTGLISIFRLTRSAGLIAGAGVSALILSVYPVSSIFFLLAIAAFVGQRFSRRLVDTK